MYICNDFYYYATISVQNVKYGVKWFFSSNCNDTVDVFGLYGTQFHFPY